MHILKLDAYFFVFFPKQVTLKIEDYEEINTSVADVSRAVKNYMKDGPMIGVFEVFGSTFDHYGKLKDKSNFFDDIYVVNAHQREQVDSYCDNHRIWCPREIPVLGVPKFLWSLMAWS